ncbi:MAG: hypothetical protein WA045_10445, partial [Nitrospira sp.]
GPPTALTLDILRETQAMLGCIESFDLGRGDYTSHEVRMRQEAIESVNAEDLRNRAFHRRESRPNPRPTLAAVKKRVECSSHGHAYLFNPDKPHATPRPFCNMYVVKQDWDEF